MQHPRSVHTVLILSFALAGLSRSAHASTLFGYYTFSNGAGATVTNQAQPGIDDGTLTCPSGTCWVAPGGGPGGGSAISLSTSDVDYVNMGPVFGFGGPAGSLATFSIQAWINTTDTGGDIVVGNNVNGQNEGYILGMGPYDPVCPSGGYSAGEISGYTADGGGGCLGTEITPPSSALNNGAWHQLVLVDNDGNLSLYVDASLVTGTYASAGPASTLSCPDADFTVGGNSNASSCNTPGTTPSTAFNGKISDVGVWDIALSQSQISAAFNDPNNPNGFLDGSVPEPATFALAALGLSLCALAKRRYRNPMRFSRSTMRGSC